MGLFGGGSSKSSSSSTTTNQDNRGVADAQGQVASASGTNVKDNGIFLGLNNNTGTNIEFNNTPTDFGAIQSALEFAGSAGDSASLSIKNALGVAEGVFNKSTEVVDKAYAEAKGGASVLQNIAIGSVLAAVAIVYFLTKKGKNA